MPKKYAIRQMRSADLVRVHEIELESFPSPWSERMLAEELELGYSHCFVLESGQKVEGYVFARAVANEFHVSNLAVSSAMRGQGLGSLLMSFMIKKARLLGCDIAYLEVRTNNLAAIRLYQKLGFSIIHLRSRYYEDGSDAYEMARIIKKSPAGSQEV